MQNKHRVRRGVGIVILFVAGLIFLLSQPELRDTFPLPAEQPEVSEKTPAVVVPDSARAALETLEVKGRAAKTNYSRSQFGDGWRRDGLCDMRNIILNRDLKNSIVSSDCKVTRGTLEDPYTGRVIAFVRGETSSSDVQVDHVVALSDAWQKGAQNLTREQRENLANDPLELLAVDGSVNQAKSSSDAASWLPPNKSFRCQYVARQIAVKQKYNLWVTVAEKDAINNVLRSCPDQLLPNS